MKNDDGRRYRSNGNVVPVVQVWCTQSHNLRHIV